MASIITATTTSGLTQSADNSGVLQLASGVGNLVTVPAVTGTMLTTASTFGGTGPSFSAYLNSSQTLSSGTITKLTFDAELWDTNNNFASSRFTPTVAGYYQVNALANVLSSATRVYLAIYKNGSVYQFGPDCGNSTNIFSSGISSIVYCNGTSDYIEIYCVFATGQGLSSGALYTWFNGAMVRAA